MIKKAILAFYPVSAFNEMFHMEPWSKPVTLKNLFLKMGWN